jgi:hypothetical protein
MRSAFGVALVVFAACGGRSGLNELDQGGGSGPGSGQGATDAGPSTDASVGADAVPSFVDAASESSVAQPDASCSAPVVGGGDCGVAMCCKVDVTWTCGGQTYRFGGACGVPQDGGPGSYQGVCDVNGQQTKMVTAPTMDCPCGDPGALAAFAEAQCGPPVYQ